jgi:hypothetical protein
MSLYDLLVNDNIVEKRYVIAGSRFGEAVSKSDKYEPFGYNSKLSNLVFWEKKYSDRGYRTISIERFVEFGGYNIPIDDVIGMKREKDELPILYAKDIQIEGDYEYHSYIS